MDSIKYTRKHPRKPVKIRVHCVGDGLYFSETTTNISEGGVGMEVVTEVSPGDHLQLELYTPDHGKVLIETEVKWVKPDTKKSSYATGLQFKELTPEQREGITYHLQARKA